MSGPEGHALLSASSASRWLNCPPSARLAEDIPDTVTPYAEEGTMAHALAELWLRKRWTTSIGPKKFTSELKKLKADPRYQPEMDRHIETYVDLIDQIANAFATLPYAAIEQRVDFSAYVPEGFGTCDCLLLSGETLHIVDFKYGSSPKGRVEAEDNPQMRLYALGALSHYSLLYNIQTVRMTICQPRLDHITTAEMTADDLRAWGEGIKPVAQQAWEGTGVMQEGSWCKFCRASGRCPKQLEVFTSLEEFGSKAPTLLTNEEIADVLIRGQRLADWLSDVQDYALSAVLAGEDIPGWKAVEGRAGNRQFTNADAAFAAARLAGIEEVMLYERKPVTLAALEKIMGPKRFAEVLGGMVVTPPGKPALAPASDNRKPIMRSTAEQDFKEVPVNG